MRLLPALFVHACETIIIRYFFAFFRRAKARAKQARSAKHERREKAQNAKKVGPVMQARTILVHVFTLAK